MLIIFCFCSSSCWIKSWESCSTV